MYRKSINAIQKTNKCPDFIECKDGTFSTNTGKGACSHHGGVLMFDKDKKPKTKRKAKKQTKKSKLFVEKDGSQFLDYSPKDTLILSKTGNIIKDGAKYIKASSLKPGMLVEVPSKRYGVPQKMEIYSIDFDNREVIVFDPDKSIKKSVKYFLEQLKTYPYDLEIKKEKAKKIETPQHEVNYLVIDKLNTEKDFIKSNSYWIDRTSSTITKPFIELATILTKKPTFYKNKKIEYQQKLDYNKQRENLIRFTRNELENEKDINKKNVIKARLLSLEYLKPFDEFIGYNEKYSCTSSKNIKDTISYIRTKLKEKKVQTSLKENKTTDGSLFSYDINILIDRKKYRPIDLEYDFKIILRRDYEDNITALLIKDTQKYDCTSIDDMIKTVVRLYNKQTKTEKKPELYVSKFSKKEVPQSDVDFIINYLNVTNFDTRNKSINVPQVKKQIFDKTTSLLNDIYKLKGLENIKGNDENLKDFFEGKVFKNLLDDYLGIKQLVKKISFVNPLKYTPERLLDFIAKKMQPITEIREAYNKRIEDKKEQENLAFLKKQAEKVAKDKELNDQDKTRVLNSKKNLASLGDTFNYYVDVSEDIQKLKSNNPYGKYNDDELKAFYILSKNYDRVLNDFMSNSDITGTFKTNLEVFLGTPSFYIQYTPKENQENKNFLHLDIYTDFHLWSNPISLENSTAKLRNAGKKALLSTSQAEVTKFFKSTLKSIFNQIFKLFVHYKTKYLSFDDKQVIEEAKKEERRIEAKIEKSKKDTEREIFNEKTVLPSWLKTSISTQKFIDSKKGVSFTPNKRGEQRKKSLDNFYKDAYLDYRYSIKNDPEKIELLDELFAAFLDKDTKLYSSLLDTNARQTSTMITGRGNYNVKRHNKLLNIADNKEKALIENREKWDKKIVTALQNPALYRGKITKKDVRDNELILQINRLFDTGIKYRGTGQSFRFTNLKQNIQSKIENRARKGETDLVNLALNTIKERQQTLKKPVFTSRSSIWKLEKVADSKEKSMTENIYKYVVGEHEHTTKKDLIYYTVKFPGQLPRNIYKDLLDMAKNNDGHYNRWLKSFAFKDVSDRNAFINSLEKYFFKLQKPVQKPACDKQILSKLKQNIDIFDSETTDRSLIVYIDKNDIWRLEMDIKTIDCAGPSMHIGTRTIKKNGVTKNYAAVDILFNDDSINGVNNYYNIYQNYLIYSYKKCRNDNNTRFRAWRKY